MDKNAIKNYAIWARKELIARVSQKALQYGIEKGVNADPNANAVNGRVLTNTEKQQRAALIAKIHGENYEQVIEEVAYTWFNRFIALRFMEVNDYLPLHIRVFSDETGAFNPQIMAEAINLSMDGLDIAKVYAFKENDQDAELFKYLVITQCNALNKVLPGMFQRIADYTELLFPDHLLEENSAVGKLVNDIPEEDWKDAVQIIGWLYQYYNTEQNELVYDGTLSKEKIKKELIPAATTIFTPDWPIRYMVENSLGKLWLEGHPQHTETLKANWKYYLDEAEQKDCVKEQLASIRAEYARIKPEDIKCIDPCEGSGHIIVYMFDVLVQIYSAYGYTATDAVSSIVKNNLYGLDLSERAAQLAYFAVMMKARQYDSRFLNRGIQPHVYSIVESNGLDNNVIEYFVNGSETLKKAMDTLVRELHDAKEYGSILNVSRVDFDAINARFDEVRNDVNMYAHPALEQLLPFVQVAKAMAQKYDVVVTNPPYLGSNRFEDKLSAYVKREYPDVKNDLSMVMYEHATEHMLKNNGFVSFITTTSWMFLTSFEAMREKQQNLTSITSLVDFGTELFDGKVGHNPIVAWTARKNVCAYSMNAVRLVDYCFSRSNEKELQFFEVKNRYIANQDDFSKIPGSPIAYWVSERMLETFIGDKIDDIASTNNGFTTGDNDRFLRLWFEVNLSKIDFNNKSLESLAYNNAKWFPYNKGGDFRKWYGNNEYLINWGNNGADIKAYGHLVPRSMKYMFRESVTWNKITSGTTAFRYKPTGTMFDVGGLSLFPNEQGDIKYLLALCNSVYTRNVLKIISPTLNCETGHVSSIPVRMDDRKKIIKEISENNISLSRTDWDSFETSWDFKKHPLVPSRDDFAEAAQSQFAADRLAKLGSIQWNYERWENECETRFNTLKANEEELNRIFIDIYGLQDELTPDVEDKDVTVRKADLVREVKSLISYAVGCMFGRYSLDRPGLVYAGGDWDASAYSTFAADSDNIIPICDDEYFTDDIVGRFIEFIKTVYGAATLEENLKFIASALGGKGSPREIIRQYFLEDFFKDHCNTYQVTGSGKRPIYWQFDSGKKNGFKCLVYMHRYKPDTIARIRTDYVHEQQSRYDTAIDGINAQLNSLTGSNLVNQKKRLAKLMAQKDEIHAYEEKIHHLADQMISIDLDDGVKVNYAKFKDVLAKIK